MQLQSFLANKGDSFLLSWSFEEKEHNLLIDAGIPGTYRFIREVLTEKRELDAIIITHVDYDHLGGLFKLMTDKDLDLEGEFEVYMNTPSLIFMPNEDPKVKVEHGIELDQMLQKKGIKAKELYVGFSETNTLILSGLEIKVLSPKQEILTELLKKWKANELYENYMLESKSSDKVGKQTENKLSYEEIIKSPESIHDWENDLINSSSIAFIASLSGCNILFLGDSSPDLVYEELTSLGYSDHNKLRIDLLKLSHHGSKHNTSKKLLSIIDCQSFFISTDGSRPYNHPDREVIVKIAEYSRAKKENPINIYTNYELDKSKFISEQEESDWNIIIKKMDILNF